jgi:hypothetical protein
MMRVEFRIPEILLGALLAVAIFAMGFVTASSFRYPPDNSGAHAAEQMSPKGSADDRLANYMLALDVLNVFLVLSTIGLWFATRRSAKVAERALTELERPFVGIEIKDNGVRFDRNTSVDSIVEENERNLIFQFANYGRTPATITEMLDRIEVCRPNELPAVIDQNVTGNAFPFGVIVGADRSSTGSTRTPSEGIDQNTWMTFTHGDNELFLIGFVRFRDIFDRRHITGFCLRFNKADNRFLFEGDERYNYTRQES